MAYKKTATKRKSKKVKDVLPKESVQQSAPQVKLCKFCPAIKGSFYSVLLLSIGLILLSVFIYFIYKKLNVAVVNGEAIRRTKYFSELHKTSGTQVLDEMITKIIIYQEAKNAGITVTQSDIDSELQKLKTSVESQGSTLEQVLTYQGVTYEQLIENIKIQKMLEKLLSDKVVITDEEIQTFYDENKDFYGSEKTFEELKENIKFQLFQERMTSAYRTWIEEKKSSSKIQKYL